MGDVRFGDMGEWAQPRVLTVQFRNLNSNDISEFKSPNARVVLHPADYANGELTYPYALARRFNNQ